MNGDWLIVAAMVIATAATGVLHREAPKPSLGIDWARLSMPVAVPHITHEGDRCDTPGAKVGNLLCLNQHWTAVVVSAPPESQPDCVTSADGKYKICNRPLLPSENCVGEVTIKGGVATVTACAGEKHSEAAPTGTVTGLVPIQSVPLYTNLIGIANGGGGGGGSGSDNRYTTNFDGHKCRFNAAHVMFCD